MFRKWCVSRCRDRGWGWGWARILTIYLTFKATQLQRSAFVITLKHRLEVQAAAAQHFEEKKDRGSVWGFYPPNYAFEKRYCCYNQLVLCNWHSDSTNAFISGHAYFVILILSIKHPLFHRPHKLGTYTSTVTSRALSQAVIGPFMLISCGLCVLINMET